MNGISERRHETSLDRAKSQDELRARERERERKRERGRERERERERPDGGVCSRVWQCFIFYRSFYTLS